MTIGDAMEIRRLWRGGEKAEYIMAVTGLSAGSVARVVDDMPRMVHRRLDEEMIALLWSEGCRNKTRIAEAVGATPPGIRQALRRMGLIE